MLVKTVLGSLLAKVAMGVGVAAASVTAVGATGALPAPAQHAVASVVAATTPFVLPDPSAGTTVTKADADGDRDDESTVTGAPGTGTSSDDPAGHEKADNHGACVSAAAHDTSGTGSHGKTVSSVARSDCGRTTSSTVVPTTSTTLPGTTTTTTPTSTTVAGARTSNSGPGGVNSGPGGVNNGKDKPKEPETVTTKAGEDDKGSGSGKGRSGSSGRD